jgi:subtilisin family serine protease
MIKKLLNSIIITIIVLSSLVPVISGFETENKNKIQKTEQIKNGITYKEYYPNAPRMQNTVYYMQDQIIITLDIDTIIDNIILGAILLIYIKDYTPLYIIEEVNAAIIKVNELEPGMNIFDLIDLLNADNKVLSAELNTICYLSDISSSSSGDSDWWHSAINLQGAWELSQGNSGVSIAIVDSGYDSSIDGLPDFKKEIDYAETYENSGFLIIPDLQANDVTENRHGTKISGTIFSTAPQCNYYSVKISHDNSDNGRITRAIFGLGIIHAARPAIKLGFGADIICIAACDTDKGALEESCFLGKICKVARNDYNCIIIASALGYEGEIIGAPAKYKSTICVGCIDDEFKIYNSPHGSEIDLVAPGKEIYTGLDKEGFSFIGHTSASTAIVAGIVGLYYSYKLGILKEPKFKDLKNCEEALCGSALDNNLGPHGWDEYFGYGLVNAYMALTGEYNLVVDFNWIPEEPKEDNTIIFKSTSRDPDGLITYYEWDFENDGKFDWSNNKAFAVNHKYSEPGSHQCKLRISSNYFEDGEIKEEQDEIVHTIIVEKKKSYDNNRFEDNILLFKFLNRLLNLIFEIIGG